MIRPRIDDEMAQQVTDHADAILGDAPLDAGDVPFQRRLEIVFADARRVREGADATRPAPAGTTRTDDGGDDLDALDEPADVELGTGDGHPGGDRAAEALIVDGL